MAPFRAVWQGMRTVPTSCLSPCGSGKGETFIRRTVSSTATGLSIALGLAITGASSSARADLLWDFSYTGTGLTGTGAAAPAISASGQLTTTDTLVGGAYTITGITGMRNGVAISALLAPGVIQGNDNLLFPSAPPLTNNGLRVRRRRRLVQRLHQSSDVWLLFGGA